jgi:hypothetical protein
MVQKWKHHLLLSMPGVTDSKKVVQIITHPLSIREEYLTERHFYHLQVEILILTKL